jgi:hypothetical protein
VAADKGGIIRAGGEGINMDLTLLQDMCRCRETRKMQNKSRITFHFIQATTLFFLATRTLSLVPHPCYLGVVDNESIQPLFLAESRFHLLQLAHVKLGADANSVAGFTIFGTRLDIGRITILA